ncbi:leucine-rich repeat and WD repeat-containing protein 1-like [Planococcus citri]|uniref:leucine-rich repeat and WD repeat-containing protein 1-like n=1 Tax=Planococcus citri TaxID=170843 RepID=UPI0031F85E07
MSKIRHRNFDYDPKLFLRCHSKTDRDYADIKTQVWQASFEPSKSSKLVATCGGNKICIIDVRSQEVDQRYTADTKEIFYTLSWGKLKHELLEEDGSILAAGGVRNIIYFMFPAREILLTQYPIKVSKPASTHISCLLFHPSDENILFCAFNNGEILILRLSINEDLMLIITEINKITCFYEIFSLSYCSSLNLLLAASDNGLLGWFVDNCDEEILTGDILRFRLPEKEGDPQSTGFDLVDSVEKINDKLIAVKCALHGYIYICSLDNIKNLARDSQCIGLQPNYNLNWSKTDNYFMGISVNYEKGLLTCGDDQGAIWIYDIEMLKKKEELPKKPLPIMPARTIQWPVVNDKYVAKSRKLDLDVYDIVIAKAAIHPKGKYIVAVTNNNTVCIWKLTSNNK